MTESQFIEQNKEKWRELESLLAKKVRDPERLYQLFEKVSGDLSYARTFYPNRSVRVYLNNLTQRIFDLVGIKKRSTGINDLIQLFRYNIPAEVVRAWPAFLVSLAIFISSMVIGAVSSAHHPQFARIILGHEYINMTEENINAGDPMAVYKKDAKVDMFLGITINNIKVAFLAFVLGLLGGVGTIILLISNGIMVGAFQYFFYSKGLFLTSFLTIWIHGTIEIASIIIAGAAGLILGQGLLFPRSYDRLTSLQLSAERAVSILLGTVPLFILAAFLEAFVTRMTAWPISAKVVIITLSALFVLYMWVWIPWRYRSFLLLAPDHHLFIPPQSVQIRNSMEYRTFEQNLTAAFSGIRHFNHTYLKYFCLPVLMITVLVFWYRLQSLPLQLFILDDEKINLWQAKYGGAVVFILFWAITAFFLYLVGNFTHQDQIRSEQSNISKIIFSVVLLALILSGIVYFLPALYSLIFFVLTGPHTYVAINKLIITRQFSWANLYKELRFNLNHYLYFIHSLSITIALWLILTLLFNTALASLLVDFISWHEIFKQPVLNAAFYQALTTTGIAVIILPFYYLMVSATYDSQWCKYHASDLKARLVTFAEPESKLE